jgi:hypothetical protein
VFFDPYKSQLNRVAAVNLSFMRDETRKWENPQSTVGLNDCPGANVEECPFCGHKLHVPPLKVDVYPLKASQSLDGSAFLVKRDGKIELNAASTV